MTHRQPITLTPAIAARIAAQVDMTQISTHRRCEECAIIKTCSRLTVRHCFNLCEVAALLPGGDRYSRFMAWVEAEQPARIHTGHVAQRFGCAHNTARKWLHDAGYVPDAPSGATSTAWVREES